jgi:hypothetical protein
MCRAIIADAVVESSNFKPASLLPEKCVDLSMKNTPNSKANIHTDSRKLQTSKPGRQKTNHPDVFSNPVTSRGLSPKGSNAFRCTLQAQPSRREPMSVITTTTEPYGRHRVQTQPKYNSHDLFRYSSQEQSTGRCQLNNECNQRDQYSCRNQLDRTILPPQEQTAFQHKAPNSQGLSPKGTSAGRCTLNNQSNQQESYSCCDQLDRTILPPQGQTPFQHKSLNSQGLSPKGTSAGRCTLVNQCHQRDSYRRCNHRKRTELLARGQTPSRGISRRVPPLPGGGGSRFRMDSVLGRVWLVRLLFAGSNNLVREFC